MSDNTFTRIMSGLKSTLRAAECEHPNMMDASTNDPSLRSYCPDCECYFIEFSNERPRQS